MSWRIVKFIEENEVEAVPSHWLKGNFCFWPPANTEIAIKQCHAVKEDWEKHKVVVMGRTIYEKFSIATAKAAKACLTSDISSDNQVLPRKRVIHKRRFSTSEESETDNEFEIPPTPQLTKDPENKPNCTIVNSSKKRGRMDSENLNWLFETESLEFPIPLENENLDMPNSLETENEFLSENFPKTCESCDKVILTNVITSKKLLNSLTRNVSVIEENQKLILRELNKIKENTPAHSTTVTQKVTFPWEKFPIKDKEDLNLIDRLLSDTKIKAAVVEYFAKIGGADYKECSRRILSKALCNKVALLFSWKGFKSKQDFSRTTLSSVIIDAIEQNDSTCTKKHIENQIAVWLTKAGERIKKEEK